MRRLLSVVVGAVLLNACEVVIAASPPCRDGELDCVADQLVFREVDPDTFDPLSPAENLVTIDTATLEAAALSHPDAGGVGITNQPTQVNLPGPNVEKFFVLEWVDPSGYRPAIAFRTCRGNVCGKHTGCFPIRRDSKISGRIGVGVRSKAEPA